MSDIIRIDRQKQQRNKYIFKNRPVQLTNESGESFMMPCICLFNKETGEQVSIPAFERWYLEPAASDCLKTSTINRRAYAICDFLNFLLWNTKINTLNEVDIDTLRAFNKHYKETDDGDSRDPDGWSRGICCVYSFLSAYYHFNKDNFQFSYTPEILYPLKSSFDPRTGVKVTKEKFNSFGVKTPGKKEKKNRFLPEEYLELFLLACEKYDPMITLGVALQAYAGLREGEVVNLTRSSIRQPYGGFGRIQKIEMDLMHDAPFALQHTGKTDFGAIKVNRKQQVYDDFIPSVCKYIRAHEAMLQQGQASDAPLFLLSSGKPMPVYSYKGRVEKVFYERFLPALSKLAEETGTMAQHAPFIEAYKKEYPGAHMYRHWFTMYLLKHIKMTNNQDPIDIIRMWRGDTSRESMTDYLHVNADIINMYQTVSVAFQMSVAERFI